MELKSFQELYIEELRDLYDAEHQLLDGLTELAETAISPELRSAYADHLEQTRTHAERLESILKKLGANPLGNPCKTMTGLIEECRDLIKTERRSDPGVLDAALIAASQKIEHFEMGCYSNAAMFAQILGEKEAATLLEQCGAEEAATNQLLKSIALHSVNLEAMDATNPNAALSQAAREAMQAMDAPSKA